LTKQAFKLKQGFGMKIISFLLLAIPLTLFANSIQKADKVVVYKSERKMELLYRGSAIRTYEISLGDSPVGHKEMQGDERTPEGDYVIDYRNPNSHYHLSLHISYPDKKDKESARKKGVKPGGLIMIHGLPNKFAWAAKLFAGRDWTDGCIAVNDNNQIEEIWNLVPNGTPISILP
jgi:murein L,D-transpeptidase YafK